MLESICLFTAGDLPQQARKSSYMAKQLFGTDGVRGIPGTYPLDDATLERLGAALGEYLLKQAKAAASQPRVLIGRDTRESGLEQSPFQQAFSPRREWPGSSIEKASRRAWSSPLRTTLITTMA